MFRRQFLQAIGLAGISTLIPTVNDEIKVTDIVKWKNSTDKDYGYRGKKFTEVSNCIGEVVGVSHKRVHASIDGPVVQTSYAVEFEVKDGNKLTYYAIPGKDLTKIRDNENPQKRPVFKKLAKASVTMKKDVHEKFKMGEQVIIDNFRVPSDDKEKYSTYEKRKGKVRVTERSQQYERDNTVRVCRAYWVYAEGPHGYTTRYREDELTKIG